jgi:hypothetical protein
MAVQVVGDLEGQEGADAHRHGTEHFVADVEVIVRIPAALAANDAVVGVGGWIRRRAGTKLRPDFHALQDEIDSELVLPLHPSQVWPDVILLAHPVLSPFHRDAPFPGEGFDPPVVFVGPLPQDVFGDRSGLVADRGRNGRCSRAGSVAGYGRE